MKKFVLLLTSVYMAIMGATYSIEAVVGSAAKGAVEGLMPLIEPIVKETVVDGIKHLKNVATGKSCALGCREVGAPYCMAEWARSKCKGGCQTIYQIGGYTLRIRFRVKEEIHTEEDKKKVGTVDWPLTEDWSLAACVRHGVSDGKRTKAGKGDKKSIAVYSVKDFKGLMRLISLEMKARAIANSKGVDLTDEELEKKKISRQQAVKEAEILEEDIQKAIENNVTKGIYGDQ